MINQELSNLVSELTFLLPWLKRDPLLTSMNLYLFLRLQQIIMPILCKRLTNNWMITLNNWMPTLTNWMPLVWLYRNSPKSKNKDNNKSFLWSLHLIPQNIQLPKLFLCLSRICQKVWDWISLDLRVMILLPGYTKPTNILVFIKLHSMRGC